MPIVTATLNSDANGFTTQQCKSCLHTFKVAFGKGSNRPIGHCPYCNYHGEFWTSPQEQYLNQVASIFPHAPPPPIAPNESANGYDLVHNFTCKHGDTIKVNSNNLQPDPADGKKHLIYCIINGRQFSI
jgi:hypothetical protein